MAITRSLNRFHREVKAAEKAINDWLLTREANRFGITLSGLDQTRALRLKIWSLRYRLSVEEILDILVPILRTLVKKPKKNIILGIRIAGLTGDGAEKILKSEIEKRYPEHEHVALWREMERERQLCREREDDGGIVAPDRIGGMLDYPTLQAYCDSYRSKIEERRRNDEVNEKQRRKRNYRWNPYR